MAEPPEPLSAALSAGRVRADDLRGREVYSSEEARIGTLVAAAGVAVVALDPRLGLGRLCSPRRSGGSGWRRSGGCSST